VKIAFTNNTISAKESSKLFIAWVTLVYDVKQRMRGVFYKAGSHNAISGTVDLEDVTIVSV